MLTIWERHKKEGDEMGWDFSLSFFFVFILCIDVLGV